MQRKKDEQTVKEFLEAKGLSCIRFNKLEISQAKTPDWKVYHNNELRAFCEVKSVMHNFLDGGRPDPTFNRLTNDIHDAMKKFNAQNDTLAYSNILAFVNFPSVPTLLKNLA